MMEVLIDETESTNTLARTMIDSLGDMSLVRARSQLAGRGQRGNSWEAEPGKNLTISLIFKPEKFPAIRQFELSECVALGVSDTLREYGIQSKVKWPNDIYVGDGKISGILLENAVMGSDLMYTIAGIGLNVNQRVFLSDAPNPVSMSGLTGREYDLEEVCRALVDNIRDRVEGITASGDPIVASCQHAEFKNALWRGDGKFYPFLDMRGKTPREFEGKIVDVLPVGLLKVEERGSITRDFGFKEIAYVLNTKG